MGFLIVNEYTSIGLNDHKNNYLFYDKEFKNTF